MRLFRKETFGTPSIYYYLGRKEIGRNTGNCYYFFNDRYIGWHDKTLNLTWHACGYESGYGELHISIFGWHSVFKTHIKSKRFPYGDCDGPVYGIEIHGGTFWIMKGGNGNCGGGSKWWAWDLPYFTKIHVRHDIECKDLVMRDAKNYTMKDGHYISPSEHPDVNIYDYEYRDYYDNSKIQCKYWVEEREWRPKWFTWTKKFNHIRRYIEIEFADEVGSKKGTWTGGVLGCSYDLNDGETPLECIKRMEKERKL